MKLAVLILTLFVFTAIGQTSDAALRRITEADKASEAIVIDALQRLAPGIPIVSEEIAGDRSADLGRRFFLVDPLDGTKEFIEKRSDFTVNIALVEDGMPSFGLVYAPALVVSPVAVPPSSSLHAPATSTSATTSSADQRRCALTTTTPRTPGT